MKERAKRKTAPYAQLTQSQRERKNKGQRNATSNLSQSQKDASSSKRDKRRTTRHRQETEEGLVPVPIALETDSIDLNGERASSSTHGSSLRTPLLQNPLAPCYEGHKSSTIPQLIEQNSLLYDVSIGFLKNIPTASSANDLHESITEPYVFANAISCHFCQATRMPYEPANFCCSKGDIKLYPITIPDGLLQLYTGALAQTVHFIQYIRAFNSLFAFTSFGVNLDPEYAINNRGIYTFRAQGQIYHSMRGLNPKDSHPSHLQLYFYDTANELEHRLHQKSNLCPATIRKVIDILKCNPYSRFFRSLSDIPNLHDYQIKLKADPKPTERTTAPPTVSQVAAIWMENEDATEVCERQITVQKDDGTAKSISYYFGCYDPLQYPLLFPMGEPGWHRGIKKQRRNQHKEFSQGQGKVLPCHANNTDELLATEGTVHEDDRKSSCDVSAREYYAYRLQIRDNDTCILLRAARLLQQYVVDMYVKIETSRLDYFRNHQKEIRADLYQGIVDSISQGETESSNIGKRIVLPGSFIGGPRDMRKRYMDAIALVEKYGKPDLFLTMTCNPSWPEILRELKSGEVAQNRPDLLARVFRSRFQELRKDVIKKQLFGQVAAYTFVVEFQKRGLPHIHMLLILKKPYKLKTASQINAIISAELPDATTHPHLYAMVRKHMMHGPCGQLNKSNPCMEEGSCKNHYPRKYCSETTVASDGYPQYQRRPNNEQVQVRGHMLNNQWVVPYNAYLLAKYDCHINVEVCSTIKAVKYLYKYIYKGHDQIIYKIVTLLPNEDIDEITDFQNARWISPPEAMWRIYKFPLYEISPAVITLQLHLDGCQMVTLHKNCNLNAIAKNEFSSRTMLTQFFWMNKYNAKAKECKLTYKEFPTHFVWDVQSKIWTQRKRQEVIGRIATSNPKQGERFYLRLLLSHCHGPDSYESLRTVHGVLYPTNKHAAVAMGLLKNDDIYQETMEQACAFQMPSSLREFYCDMLVHCNPINPLDLFLRYEDTLSEDYMHFQKLNKQEARQELLTALALELESMGKSLEDYQLQQLVTKEAHCDEVCREIRDELNLDISETDLASQLQLNPAQKLAYDAILEAVFIKKEGCFFVDGPGGTGKTFLYKAILAAVRSQNLVALATATSGIAASILPNGRTTHSRFKIPIKGNGKLACDITRESGTGQLLQSASLIIWDEAGMAKKQSIEALDKSLQDITKNKALFGGKVIVFGGDFRQVLPVIPKGTREASIDASLVRSYIWPLLTRFSLETNMRARADPSFSEYLLRLGNGTERVNSNNQITLPDALLLTPSLHAKPIEQLLSFVFPNFDSCSFDPLSLTNSVILTPKNDVVHEINDLMISAFPGEAYRYLSFDETENEEQQGLYIDFINSLTPQGLPAHELVLKINCPIIMLRNINPSKGMCNGTRLICKSFTSNVIVAEIALGQRKGDIVFIPRIPLEPNDPHLYPVVFTRRQFPIRLCFAMTINKAQGQTLDKVGIYLPQPVFAHGQLYVAISRATAAQNIRVLIDSPEAHTTQYFETDNIVYKELLEESQCTK